MDIFIRDQKGSQLGAVVSPQSSVIPNREFFENKLKDLEKEYENKEIPRPEDWGGYLQNLMK